MDEECGEPDSILPRQQDDPAETPHRGLPAGWPGIPVPAGGLVYPCDPRMLAVAGHLSQGGWCALLEPFAVVRPHTRGFQREFRLVAMIGGN